MFRIFGIQLAIHASFVLLLVYFGVMGWTEGGPAGAVWSVLLIVAFFACVVLHELGHSLTAQRYGVRVPRILLMPIGGMAEFDRIPRKPSAELLITIAGPAVNFLLVALLLPLVWTDLWSEQPVPLHGTQELLIQLTFANALMGVFNLLPVFPMDGGRILRALLAIKLPYLRATLWASLVGKVLAVLLAITAVYFENFLAAALFIFIYFAGDAEYRHVLLREREAAYWQDWTRRMALERAAQERGGNDNDPPPPPIILHGPN